MSPLDLKTNRKQESVRLPSVKKFNLPSNYIPPHLRHNAFYKWVYSKIHFYGEDCVIGVSGPTGFGKTTLSVKLAEILDVDSNGVSRFKDREYYEVKNDDGTSSLKEVLVPRLINSISSYKELRKKTDWPVGTAFIVDEAQVLINSRDFMSSKNKDVVRLLSTGRVFRSITFLNLPYWYNLDSQIKNYLHAVILVDRPDRVRRVSRWTPYLIKPQGYNKPPWTIKFRRRDRLTNRIHVLDGCESSLPSPALNLAQQLKTTEWKHLLHQGKITSSGDLETNIPPKGGIKTSNAKAQAVDYWFNHIKDEKKYFTSGERYSYGLLYDTVSIYRSSDQPLWTKPIARLVSNRIKSYDLARVEKEAKEYQDNAV